MLLELTALIAGINTATATIKKCAEAGQDISSIAGMIQKLGSSEVQITKLQNSGALSPEEALKATLAKKELQDHMQQIKDLFVLSGNGHLYTEMIENMVAARKAEQARLEAEMKRRKKLKKELIEMFVVFGISLVTVPLMIFLILFILG